MGRPRKNNTHLPPCVHPKHGAFYYVKGGKWTMLGHSLKAALAEYAIKFESGEGGLDELINRTLAAVSGRKAKPLSEATKTQYGIAAKKLKKIFGAFRDPRDVKQKHIFALRAGLSKTPNMANRVLSFTRMVFDQAAQEGLVDRNEAFGVTRLGENKRDRLPSMEELGSVYSKSGERLRAIVDIKIRTGQRITNVLRIRRADLLDEGIAFPPQKKGEKNIVPWTSELREVVARAKALNKNVLSFYLLPGRKGKPPCYRSVRDQWERACKAVGVADLHLHDLRAVAATYAEEQGHDPQKLLAHTTPAHTRRYLRGRKPKVTAGPSFGRLIDKGSK